jgi:NAD(P)-dependent dehydrogenase (short-subunit alcohol dehydrogenase family)
MRAPADPRVWFITGASRGLGQEFLRAATRAGDYVVAVARTMAGTAVDAAEGQVLRLSVDVTDRAAVFEAVEQTVAHFGRLDVVVNNAGTMSSGFVEEFTEEQARAQMEVNFFGALWVSQAVVPVLRTQAGGHLVQMSSIGGVGGFPTTGLYSASKFALEGLSEALAQELAPFGVHVTIAEPGGYWTDLYRDMTVTSALPAYAPARQRLQQQFAEHSIDSHPSLAAEALMKVVDSDHPPLRLILGSTVYDAAHALSEQRRRTWAAWESVSRAAEQAIGEPLQAGGRPGPNEAPAGV